MRSRHIQPTSIPSSSTSSTSSSSSAHEPDPWSASPSPSPSPSPSLEFNPVDPDENILHVDTPSPTSLTRQRFKNNIRTHVVQEKVKEKERPEPIWVTVAEECHRWSIQAKDALLRFLSNPSQTIPVAFALFGIAYFLLFDIRTHLILLCALIGTFLIAASGFLALTNAGGLLSFLSPTTQHLLLDYNLLELIKISYHSRTLQDILSLIIFPLSKSERKRIIERLPAKLSAVLTRRGIVHLLPKPAKRVVGNGKQPHQHSSHHDENAEHKEVSAEQVQNSILSSSSQPNLVLLSESTVPRFTYPSRSPSASPQPSSFGPRPTRSRSLSALVEAENAAGLEASQNDDEADAAVVTLRQRKKPTVVERLKQEESKDALEDNDEVDANASIASTSSSSSSSSSSTSPASRSSSDSSEDEEPDVRNYDECTPSPAHLLWSSAEQTAAWQYPITAATASTSTALTSTLSSSSSSSSSSIAPASNSSYRAPLSTFLPLPPSIDDLNFSNLLDRQIKEHAKEGIKNFTKAIYDEVQASIDSKWNEVKQLLPESVLPYCNWQHARHLIPIGSSLMIAHFTFRSPRFRAFMIRFLRLGFDCSVLSGALYAAITAYRELAISTPLRLSSSPRHSPSASITTIPSLTTVSASSSSLTIFLPSYALYRRMHALPASSQVSTLFSSYHSLKLFISWLVMRYRASGPLRTSTLVLMLWFAWLARNSSIVQTQKEKVVEKLKQVIHQVEK